MDTLTRFRIRVLNDWLPKYCSNPTKRYDVSGFEEDSLSNLSEIDAADCISAIDSGVVHDTGHGYFRAHHSSANEYLFWEGSNTDEKRRIRLWLEPVITFAAVERLRQRHHWPIQNIGVQPKGWAFDLAAYDSAGSPLILGEVKKTKREVLRLEMDILSLAAGANRQSVLENSAKKWDAIAALRPRLVWIIGPADESLLFELFTINGHVQLRRAPTSALEYSDA